MEALNPKIVPLGSLAIISAGFFILVLIMKAILSRKADNEIEIRMSKLKNEKNESLSEQKSRLERLLQK